MNTNWKHEQTITDFQNQLYKRCLKHNNDTDECHKFVLYISSNPDTWKCAICKKIELIQYNKKTNLVKENTKSCVDHYHHDANGKGPLRGLICNRCNTIESKIYTNINSGKSYQDLINIYGLDLVTKFDTYYSIYNMPFPMDTRNG